MTAHQTDHLILRRVVHLHTVHDIPGDLGSDRRMAAEMILPVVIRHPALRFARVVKQHRPAQVRLGRDISHREDRVFADIQKMEPEVLRRLHHPVKFRQDNLRHPELIHITQDFRVL